MDSPKHSSAFKRSHLGLMLLAFLFLMAKADNFDRYVYSHLSCADLIPLHESVLNPNSMKPIIFDPKPAMEEDTTAIPTPLNQAAPGLDIPATIDTSANGFYALNRELQVTVSSSVPFEGFMIQAHSDIEPEGTFTFAPKLTEMVNCNGPVPNSVIDSDKPLLLNNVTATWRAPTHNVGAISMRASIVVGDQFQIIEQRLLPSTLPPQDKTKCAVSQSCFRLCPSGFVNCPFTSSHLTAIIANNSDDATVTISLGARMDLMTNYAAIGFTKDRTSLSEMDLNICYKTEEDDIQIAHLYLENKREKPLPHQGILQLDAAYMDGPTLWCSFTRPLSGNDLSRLNLEAPIYFYFFTGRHYDAVFEMPNLRKMIRTRQLINQLKGMPINMVTYDHNGQSQLKYSLLLVSLGSIFFELRFLYFI